VIDLPASIKDHIERCVAGEDGPRYAIDDEARSHGAIALMGTIGMIWGLRPDGTFWQFDADFGTPLSPLPEELQINAIVYGEKRHPWLNPIVPVRPATATSCQACEGRGAFPVTVGEVLCSNCHGLGWVA
jgi:hypothetical protein